jgi:Fe(3+) dicitrate transport protein
MRNHRTSLVLTHVFDAPSLGWRTTTNAYRHDYARVWRKLNRFAGASLADVLSDPETPANQEHYAVLSGRADTVAAGQTLLIGPNDRRFVSQGVATEFERDASTGPLTHHLEVGLRVHNDSITRRHSEKGYLLVDGELSPDAGPTVVTTANRASTLAVSVHALDAVSWRALTLTPGVRVETIASVLDDQLAGSSNARTVVAVMPGAGAYYSIVDQLGVLGGVYRGFSPPPPGSSDGVAPEYSLNYEAGARFSSGRSRISCIGFFNDYSNLTNVCTLSGGCSEADLDRQFDAGQANIYGFETYLEHTPDWRGVEFPLTAAYTHTRGEFGNTFSSADPIYGDVTRGLQKREMLFRRQ